jgi:hypothetical protein
MINRREHFFYKDERLIMNYGNTQTNYLLLIGVIVVLLLAPISYSAVINIKEHFNREANFEAPTEEEVDKIIRHEVTVCRSRFLFFSPTPNMICRGDLNGNFSLIALYKAGWKVVTGMSRANNSSIIIMERQIEINSQRRKGRTSLPPLTFQSKS